MAKKDDENLARVLSTTFPMDQAGTLADDSIVMGYNAGWKTAVVDTGFVKVGFVYKINTWDLSGYSLQDKTLFPQAVMMQDLNGYPNGGANIPALDRLTLVSTTPISEADLTNINNVGMWNTPGSPGSTFNLDNILRGRIQGYIQDSSVGSTLYQTFERSWGTGDATAADKVWVAECYFFFMTGAVTSFFIPNSAVVMPSIVAKEPEMEYFMRLSRSLEPVY